MPTLSYPFVIAPAVVIVDGLTRCGKSLVGPVLSSLDRMEIERLEPEIEWVADMHLLGKIERDAAVTFLRLTVHRHFYEGLVARNTNFRFGDHSSVWQAPRRLKYFQRLFVDERLPLMARVERERPIFQTIVHHQLMNLPLYADAFGERLRMVEVVKDPVDLVASWMRKRKGELIGRDPLITLLFTEWGDHLVPFYTAGWEQEYIESPPLDRVILMIGSKWRASMGAYRSFSPEQLRCLRIVPLEPFAERPDEYLADLASFIGTTTTGQTRSALAQARCPRTHDVEARRRRLASYMAEAGAHARGVLEQLVDEHATLLSELRTKSGALVPAAKAASS